MLKGAGASKGHFFVKVAGMLIHRFVAKMTWETPKARSNGIFWNAKEICRHRGRSARMKAG
jgi:hypothetical protein